jgi:hypothetical protein
MIDIKVPFFSSEWLGTGTVMVDCSSRFCITTWLPRCRTSTKPWRERMPQTSRPERTRSLPNLNLKSRDKYFRMPTPFDLCRVRTLKEEFDGFLQVRSSGFYAVTLARNIELGTKSDVCIALAFNNGCKLLHLFHSGELLLLF